MMRGEEAKMQENWQQKQMIIMTTANSVVQSSFCFSNMPSTSSKSSSISIMAASNSNPTNSSPQFSLSPIPWFTASQLQQCSSSIYSNRFGQTPPKTRIPILMSRSYNGGGTMERKSSEMNNILANTNTETKIRRRRRWEDGRKMNGNAINELMMPIPFVPLPSLECSREQLSSPEDENEATTTSSMHQITNSILPNYRSSWSTIHRTQSLLKPITFEMVDDLMDSTSSEFKKIDQQYTSLHQIKKLSLKRRHKMRKRKMRRHMPNMENIIFGPKSRTMSFLSKERIEDKQSSNNECHRPVLQISGIDPIQGAIIFAALSLFFRLISILFNILLLLGQGDI